MRTLGALVLAFALAACDGGEPLGMTSGLVTCDGTITEYDGGNGATCFTTCYTGHLATKVNNCRGFAFNGQEIECKSSCEDAAPTSAPPPSVPTPPTCEGRAGQLVRYGTPMATIGGKQYPCYSCVSIDAPAGGCFYEAGGSDPVLCVSDYAAAGCH